MKSPYYALITGGSEGFGKALAFECARRGMNLILVALPETGLDSLSEFIKRNFGVDVVYFEMDLRDQTNCHILHDEVVALNLPVKTLINNAGIGGMHFFRERPPQFYYGQLLLNVATPTLLTHLFYDDLCRHNPSYIMNVSSLAAYFNLPHKQVYGATKSYLLSFSRSLAPEFKKNGVTVTAVCPGGMNTSPLLCYQNRCGGPVCRISIMEPETVARIAIDKMLQGKTVVIPGIVNRFLIFLDRLTPAFIKHRLVVKAMTRLKSGKIHSMIQHITQHAAAQCLEFL